MVFTDLQNKFIIQSYYRSGNLENGSWVYSNDLCFRQFQQEFPDCDVNYGMFTQHMRRMLQRFEDTGSIMRKKPPGRPTVLTENVLADIQNRIETSPTKPLSQLAAQTGFSKATCYKALKNKLHMHPYKLTVVQQLYPLDFIERINYCHWFNNHLNDDDLLNLSFFSDEAWFHLSGYINSQNYRTWSNENPHTFVETTLHPIKIGVFMAMSRRRIIGPIFFEDNVTAIRYQQLLDQFVNQLHDDELQQGYFQQDRASAHTASTTINYLQQYYDERIISTGIWPARSPDLTPLDFFLFGYLKNTIYRRPLHTLDELKEAIINATNEITEDTLGAIFENMKRRIILCLEAEGQHFEHSL